MGQHKKSKSWSTLISLPAMLTPSSSSNTRQSSQPTTTTNSNNAAAKQENQPTRRTNIPPSTISMKKSNSQQQYPSHSYGISNGNGSYKSSKSDNSDGNDDEINNKNKINELDSHDKHDGGMGGLGTDMALHSLPLFYLFSSDALADEYAKEDTIIPFMEPPSLALDQATLIAGVLESLVRVVDDIPTGISDDDGSSGNVTNDTEHEECDTDGDGDDDETIERDGGGMGTFDMDRGGDSVHPIAAMDTWRDDNSDNENGMTFDSGTSSPDNLQPSSSTDSSTGRLPFTIPYTDQQQHSSPTSTRHAYPRPSTSTLSTFSSSTSAYTLQNNDHHHNHNHNHHYHSDLLACPFTIIGLGSFKVVLWPSVLDSISGNQDLNLVILVSPKYPDHDIIDIMYKMEKSLNHAFSSVVDTTINAQLIGQHLIPLVGKSFTVV